MPALTNVTGTLYTSSGAAITTGKLYITLPQDMVAGDGTKVIPSTVTVDLAATSGAINVSLAPTSTASPAGMYYFIEYDPAPSDTTKSRRQKDGYWWNWWNVPAVGPVTIGDFPPAHRRPLPDDVLPAAPAAAPAPDFQIVTWSANALTSNNVVKTGSVYELDRAVFITPATYTPTATFEFTATFRAVSAQHVGFGLDLVSAPWAIISTNDASGIFARVNSGTDDATLMSGVSLGVSHTFKIVWAPSSIAFYADGVLKVTKSVSLATPMNGMASDFGLEGTKLTISGLTINGSRVFI